MIKSDESQAKVLSNKQIKFLRGMGHKLSPVVLVGKEGLSKNVITTVETELTNHELIKVKIGSNSSVDKKEAATLIPAATKSCLVQLIGKTLILFRENPQRDKEKNIRLPKT